MKKQLLILLSSVLLVTSCGGQSSDFLQSTSMKSAEDASAADKPLESGEDGFDNGRLLTYEADVWLAAKEDEKEEIFEQVKTIAKKYGGYMESRYGSSINVKVKADKFEKALDEVSQIAELLSKDVSVEDISDSYNDVELRIANLEKSYKRLSELMDEAKTVEEVVTVERELSRVKSELDVLRGRKQGYDKRLKYSSISVRIEDKVTPGPLGWVFKAIYIGVKWLFVWD